MQLFLLSLIFLLNFLAFTTAISYSYPIRRVGSLREKLLKNGKYQDFLLNLKSGSQPFVDWSDDYYVLSVNIGTPPVEFSLSLDTTSSFLWILDCNCVSKDCYGDPMFGLYKARYNSSESSSFKNGSGAFETQFDGKPVTGYLAKDTVDLGAGLVFPEFEFGSATVVPQEYLDQPLDGVLGFGFPYLAVNDTKTPLEALMPSLDQKLFTIWMDRKIGNTRGGMGGLITYGAVDTVNCDAKINYVELSTKNFWGFDLDGFSIGSFSRNQKEMVISDTASGWIGAPVSVISAIVKATGAKYDWNLELYTVPCFTMQTQPDLHFKINGIDYTVKSVEYILDLFLENKQCALTFFAMVQSGGFGPSWVLGDTFIRSYCHIYDYENMRIGFASAHHSFQ